MYIGNAFSSMRKAAVAAWYASHKKPGIPVRVAVTRPPIVREYESGREEICPFAIGTPVPCMEDDPVWMEAAEIVEDHTFPVAWIITRWNIYIGGSK